LGSVILGGPSCSMPLATDGLGVRPCRVLRTLVTKIAPVPTSCVTLWPQIPTVFIRHRNCDSQRMIQPPVSLSQEADSYVGESVTTPAKSFSVGNRAPNILVKGIQRRTIRAQRRRRVGRAYDMALEIAQVIPPGSRVLDVGCGTGFIAHHLSAMLGTRVIGIDMDASAEAAIDYRQFDGHHLPLADEAVDAVLFCYVLHHMQDVGVVMKELRRVLSAGGLAVVYEDIPANWWDRLFCGLHNMKWRKRTGACTFRSESEWRILFNSASFEVVTERRLSRWRNFVHPVRKVFYVLKAKDTSVHG
jgi:ubiquinone/menaquinone biosynthesis C-methylase UbiE